MLVRAAYSIFFLFIWCYLSLGYITRLHCRRHGNFSIIKLNTRFNGIAEKSMDGLTRSECVLSCLTCDSCSFVNYHATNLACELMNSEGNETPEEGWQFLSTNYGTRNRGPICRSISPCALTEACVDTCFEDDQVGYKCIPNQFKKLPPAIMGAYPHDVSHPIGYLQDGKDYTYAGALGATNSHFVIHFSTTIPVRFVTIRLQSTVQKGVITVDNKICS
ncbi:uncharacterized protein LOC130646255 [Hydractinia symbiolongicarpus]|uniref:uncharacterized protein LOC130646255 n=1 Tax=Hydractinia symbiolongicarpus TaxID=13093 RepID=UPI00254F3162|nr:uncharacterized protein LOC130646255 [Hydractinia symbiolongicarpus]